MNREIIIIDEKKSYAIITSTEPNQQGVMFSGRVFKEVMENYAKTFEATSKHSCRIDSGNVDLSSKPKPNL